MTEIKSSDLYIAHISYQKVEYVQSSKWLGLEWMKQFIGAPHERPFIECVYRKFRDPDITAVVDDCGAISELQWTAVLPWTVHIYGDFILCGKDRTEDGSFDLCGIEKERLIEAVSQIRLVV